MRIATMGFVILASAANAWADTDATKVQTENTQQQSLYRSIWHVADNGDITNLQSGLICDSKLGDFSRTDVLAFRPNGLDVGCNYANAAKNITITEYITRRQLQSLADDIAEARNEMLHRMDGLVLLSDSAGKDFEANAGWLKEVYARPNSPFREGIWLADLSGWTLEYRVSYRADLESTTFAALASMAARARETAGVQLARCAKSAAPVRDGTAVADPNELQQSLVMMSLIGAALDDPKVKSEPQKPRTWCAEDQIGSAEVPLLLWHAVFDDGTDASADKITGMTVSDPPVLESAPDSLTDAVRMANDSSAKPRWVATVEQNGKTWFFAAYDGRPSGMELSKVAAAVFTGRAKPIGGYSYDKDKISIQLPDSK